MSLVKRFLARVNPRGRMRVAAMLAAGSLVLTGIAACSADGADARPAASGKAQSQQQKPKLGAEDFLLTPQQLRKFEQDGSVRGELVNICTANAKFAPHPVAQLELPDKYGVNGVELMAADNPFGRDAFMAYRFALCYLSTGDAQWAAKAQQILDAWSDKLQRVESQQARDTLNFNGPYMVAAAMWTRKANDWQSAHFRGFVRRVLLPAAELDNQHNHGLWAVFLTVSSAVYLQDRALLSRGRDLWLKHVEAEIEPSGVLPEEIERSDNRNYVGGPRKGIKGIAYTHYALLPATLAAKLLADAGMPVWDSQAGQRLDAASVVVAGWILDPQSFPYAKSNPGLYDVTNFAYFPILYAVYRQSELLDVIDQKAVTGDSYLLADLFHSSLPTLRVATQPAPVPPPMTAAERAANERELAKLEKQQAENADS